MKKREKWRIHVRYALLPLVPCTQMFQFHQSYLPNSELQIEQVQNQLFLDFPGHPVAYIQLSHPGVQSCLSVNSSNCRVKTNINYGSLLSSFIYKHWTETHPLAKSKASWTTIFEVPTDAPTNCSQAFGWTSNWKLQINGIRFRISQKRRCQKNCWIIVKIWRDQYIYVVKTNIF